MRRVLVPCPVGALLLLATGAAAQSPYPPSTVISSVRFAPVDEIICDADGSDNFPITWADDGDLYTSFGDGWGFDPRTDVKLSLGFARVSGPGDGFAGVNIRSPSGERSGDGASGAKASGMLMVDGVLYMWVRNTSNATLFSSSDHAATWVEASWRWSVGFGAPTFLNFGRNYEGARDDYVYAYSQDGDSAYETYDGAALARAPRDRILEEAAWEFFAGFEADGTTPRWTADVAAREPVLPHPGRAYRMDAAYAAPIDRYLLLSAFGRTDASWAMFDAPTPWGPWTTVVYEESGWDLAPNVHGFRLPTKWIAADGRTAYLVFSGRDRYDAFCVRRMELTLGEVLDGGVPGTDGGPGVDAGGPARDAGPEADSGSGTGDGEGGCSCRVTSSSDAGALALLLLVVLGWRRCRRRGS